MMNSNLRKQFQRVTQRFDQTLGRSEKSEVLNQEQQNLDRRVDLIQKICQNVSKKIQACLISQGPLCDVEKRMKKVPKHGLSQACIESSVHLGPDTCAGRAFHLCGEAEGFIATNTFQMELDVESRVLSPLNNLLEVDVPSIQKLRKQLTSRTLDMDAAKTRYGSATRQVQQSGPNPTLQAKVDQAREEVEDAVAKVEQTRDQLATEVYTFVARESDIGQYLLELIQIETEYHRQALESLERIIPHLKESIELSVVLPVFGLDLKEHLDHSGREIAVVLEECIMALYSPDYNALKEEGLFRIAGGASKVKKLRAVFNSNTGPVCFTPEEFHSHNISSVLKQYLRELPEPLMRSDLYSDWMQAAQKSGDQRLVAMTAVLNKMPIENKKNLGYLIKFLSKLSEFADTNKMSASNIALVMGPNLVWDPSESSSNMLSNTGIQSSLVETLITSADYFFPDPIDFSVPQPMSQSSSFRHAAWQSEGTNGSSAISSESSSTSVARDSSTKTPQSFKRQPKPATDTSVRPACSTSDNDRVSISESGTSPRFDRPKVAPPDRPFIAPALPEKPLKPIREITQAPVTSRPPEPPEKPSSRPPEPPEKPSLLKPTTETASASKTQPVHPPSFDSFDTSTRKSVNRETSVSKTERPPRPQLPPHPRSAGKLGESDDVVAKKEVPPTTSKGLPEASAK